MGYVEQQSARPAPFWRAASPPAGPFAAAKNYRFQAYEIARAPTRGEELYFMQTLGVEELDGEIGAWRELTSRTLEPNAFFEPGFALSLARHST
ncbi:MAG TPA: hypothetical protein VED87_02915, partial [Methylocystis sp.]|nr:hypothetical protein [Methylocystis sp.]